MFLTSTGLSNFCSLNLCLVAIFLSMNIVMVMVWTGCYWIDQAYSLQVPYPNSFEGKIRVYSAYREGLPIENKLRNNYKDFRIYTYWLII